MWVLADGTHPLQRILRGHIHQVSSSRWGLNDLTWLVSKCGTMKLEGSAPWRNICRGWATLKQHLLPSQPSNLEEWENLPLWRPHVNHVDKKKVKCSTIAQRLLHHHGFKFMRDVWSVADGLHTWQQASQRGAPPACEAAFQALISNLKAAPEIGPPGKLMDVYFENRDGPEPRLAWHFRLQAQHATERRAPFLSVEEPVRTFRRIGKSLTKIANCRPGAHRRLRRILVRTPAHSTTRIYLGPWRRDRVLTSQYQWTDGTSLHNSSTSQLRLLQVHIQPGGHGALEKWNVQLGSRIPDSLWEVTWMTYRSAAENTFLWQLLYRIPATNKWRLPDRPALDPDTWCPRCPSNTPEDSFHCIWACPASRECWTWCASILSWVSYGRQLPIQLQPAHVFIAEELPQNWKTPVRFWHTLRAITCWIIWKERNKHIFQGEAFSSPRTVALVWHRLSIYVRAAWSDLLSQVRQNRFSLVDARERMDCFFGAEGKIWTLHEVQVRVAPVPPRPP